MTRPPYTIRHSLQLAAVWAGSWAACFVAAYGVIELVAPR